MTRAYQAFRKMSPGSFGGQSRVATPPAPAVRKVAVGVPSVDAPEPPPEAMYRIWPEDCGSTLRPAAPTGPLLHVGEGGYAWDHYTPKVCALTSTTAIYCWDSDNYPTAYRTIACVVTRSGLDLTSGTWTVIDFNGGTDLPSEILRVSDTTAILVTRDRATDNIRIRLLEVGDGSIDVVQQYNGFSTETGFMSLSRVPGTNKFLVTGDGSKMYIAEVSGTSMTVTDYTRDSTYDTEILALSPTKFIIGYFESGKWTIRPARLEGSTITWGNAVIMPDRAESPSGNTDPVLGRLSNDSAVVFYRSLWIYEYPDSVVLADSCVDTHEEARAMRLDVSEDLEITFYLPIIVDGTTESYNTAPFCLDDTEDGKILYVYDVVQVGGVVESDEPAVIVTVALADGETGLHGYGTSYVNVPEGSSWLYWGHDVAKFPGSNVALLANASPASGYSSQSYLRAVEVQ